MSIKNPFKNGTMIHRIFEILSDLKWHCAECELPGSQPAKALQGLRKAGFQLEKVGANWGKGMFCKKCGRKTSHRRLVSLEKEHTPIKRSSISAVLRRRITNYYSGRDEFLGYKPSGRKIEIDHRIPEVR